MNIYKNIKKEVESKYIWLHFLFIKIIEILFLENLAINNEATLDIELRKVLQRFTNFIIMRPTLKFHIISRST